MRVVSFPAHDSLARRTERDSDSPTTCPRYKTESTVSIGIWKHGFLTTRTVNLCLRSLPCAQARVWFPLSPFPLQRLPRRLSDLLTTLKFNRYFRGMSKIELFYEIYESRENWQSWKEGKYLPISSTRAANFTKITRIAKKKTVLVEFVAKRKIVKNCSCVQSWT